MDNHKEEIAERIFESLRKGDMEEVISYLSKEFDKEKTDKLKFTKTPFLNGVGEKLGKTLMGKEWAFDRLFELWKKGGRDERLIVISAIGKMSRKNYNKTKEFVLKILEDISDWEICDQLALKTMVNLAVSNREDTFSLLNRWIESPNKWLRRLAVATIPPYIRARNEESMFCLEFLDKTMKEKDKDVKKAVAWALREISKKDPEAVFNFLMRWKEYKDKNTEWIIKEGMKKLSEEQKRRLKQTVR